MKMKHVKQEGKRTFCMVMAVLLLCTVFSGVYPVKKAQAKVNDGSFAGLSPAAYYSGSTAGLFKKIKFSGGKVTFQGKFKVKVNGTKKSLTKLTLPVAANCKYYEAWDTGLHAVKKSKMQKYLQKGEFIELDVTVKSGKVVRFINGA